MKIIVCVHKKKAMWYFCVSKNVVKLEPGGAQYEDLNKIKSGQGNSEQHSADDECSGNKQAEAVYTTAGDTIR